MLQTARGPLRASGAPLRARLRSRIRAQSWARIRVRPQAPGAGEVPAPAGSRPARCGNPPCTAAATDSAHTVLSNFTLFLWLCSYHGLWLTNQRTAVWLSKTWKLASPHANPAPTCYTLLRSLQLHGEAEHHFRRNIADASFMESTRSFKTSRITQNVLISSRMKCSEHK